MPAARRRGAGANRSADRTPSVRRTPPVYWTTSAQPETPSGRTSLCVDRGLPGAAGSTGTRQALDRNCWRAADPTAGPAERSAGAAIVARSGTGVLSRRPPAARIRRRYTPSRRHEVRKIIATIPDCSPQFSVDWAASLAPPAPQRCEANSQNACCFTFGDQRLGERRNHISSFLFGWVKERSATLAPYLHYPDPTPRFATSTARVRVQLPFSLLRFLPPGDLDSAGDQ